MPFISEKELSEHYDKLYAESQQKREERADQPRKITQFQQVMREDSTRDSLFALDEDGVLWERFYGRDYKLAWNKVTPLPSRNEVP